VSVIAMPSNARSNATRASARGVLRLFSGMSQARIVLRDGMGVGTREESGVEADI